MATLYTDKDITNVLKKLRIAPENGKVDGNEAARILTWRANNEYKVDYAYDAVAVRQHVKQKHFPPGTVDPTNKRRNLYQVEAVFKLPIAPKRGVGRRKPIAQSA